MVFAQLEPIDILHRVPWTLMVAASGRDVTADLDTPALLKDVPDVARLPQGVAATPLVAASACRVILGLLDEALMRTHAPGPLGHPGGYPVVISRGGVRLALPPDLPLEGAVAINEAGQRAEGAERVEPDGTVVFTETAYTLMKEVVGFECRQLAIPDVDAVARELAAKLKELGERFGTKLRVH